mmetsp:Transcript_14170/g.20767  ORF Transcript_14170/g.20767 Transcript_14170/m.20767 type:complete len:229 (-) Transcript_14170:1239-1925(-)
MKYLLILLALISIQNIRAFTLLNQKSRNPIPFKHSRLQLGKSDGAVDQPDPESTKVDASSSSKTHGGGIPKITSINSRDEFLEFIAEDDRLCVVEFYAGWCKSCHRFGLKYKKLAHDLGDLVDGRSGDVKTIGKARFATVEHTKNARLFKTFGIKKLPYIQIYRTGDGKIDEYVCGPRHFDEKVKTRVEDLLDMYDEKDIFEQDMSNGQTFGDDILSSLYNVTQKVDS